MEDHIHLLLQIPPTMTLAEAVRTVKSNSSSWMKQEIKKFAWQEGYGGFSVSKSKIPVVVRYIKNQERHHKKMSFEDEFRALLEKHGIEFDPKYVFG
jgi:putative transposase